MCLICNDEIKPGMTELDCEYCDTITHIPMIEGLQKIWCQYCSLRSISRIPGLIDIRCYKTTLTNISGFNQLEFLDCCDCLYLIKITDLPSLKTLYCVRCPILGSITNTPNLIFLSCCDCSSLVLIPYKTTDNMLPMYKNYHSNCKWLKYHINYDENIRKVIVLQQWFKNILYMKKITNIIYQIIPLYYHPDAKGGYFDKKNMLDFFEKV